MFLFDTDHINIIQQQTGSEFDRIIRRMSGHVAADFFVSVVSFQEQVLGWNAFLNKARTEETIVRGYRMFQNVLTDFATFQVLLFDSAAAQTYTAFRARSIRIGTMDLRIAAIAISRRFTVISRNTVDFAQAPGLQLEDWTLP